MHKIIISALSIIAASIAASFLLTAPVYAKGSGLKTAAAACAVYKKAVAKHVSATKTKMTAQTTHVDAKKAAKQADIAKVRAPSVDYAASNVDQVIALRDALSTRSSATVGAERTALRKLLEATKKETEAGQEATMSATLVYAFGGECANGLKVTEKDLAPAPKKTAKKD